MSSLQQLAMKYWWVAMISIFALLWVKAHDQVVAARATSQLRADSLQAAMKTADSAITESNRSRDSVRQLTHEMAVVQAAAARRQVVEQTQNDSVIAHILATVPDSVKGAVQALRDGFDRERTNFHQQIENANRSNIVLLEQVHRDSTTIADLHRQYDGASQGWVKCERRGPSTLSKVAGVVTKGLALYGVVHLVTNRGN